MKSDKAQTLLLITGISLLALSATNLYGAGAQEQKTTRLDMAEQARQFLAPGNPDAVNRTLKLPFSQVTIPGTGRVIISWTFTVYNSNGNKVYEDSRLENRDRGFLGELFNVGDKPKVDIPADLTWDGSYRLADGATNGQPVPDGNYTYLITIVDDAGNRAMTPPFNITIKNTPISIDYIRIPVSIFSPSGKRNTAHIDQSGSREFFWEGRFTDAEGNLVKKLQWQNTGDEQLQDMRPPAFDWDGRDENGAILPEGNYFYTLEGHNRAGAVLAKSFDAPILLTQKSGALKVGTDLSVFSPNTDGRLDRLTFQFESNDSAAILSWNFVVSDATNAESVRWIKNGQTVLPAFLSWDGTDLSKRVLPDGKYQAILHAQFANGDSADSLPAYLEIDNTPPKAMLLTNTPVFGGSSKPSATIGLQASRDAAWTLHVLDKDNNPVMELPVDEPDGFSWEFVGVDKRGTTLSDGLYTITATGLDSAENLGTVSVRVRKDSRLMNARIELSQPILVPNKGRQGTVRITPILETTDSIEAMDLAITDQKGNRLVNQTAHSIQTYWDWNGKDETGKMGADGLYDVFALITYSNGTVAQAKAQLRIDSKQVDLVAGLKASTAAFIPSAGSMYFQPTATPPEGIKTWKLSLTHEREGEIQSFGGSGPVPAKIIWDGRNASHTIIDGSYVAKLAVLWENGLSAESSVNPAITVSSSGPKMDLNLSSTSFVPGNIDGPQSLTITIDSLKNSVAVNSWDLTITDPRGKTFRSWQGEGTPPKNIVWDGLSNLGISVESGADYLLTLRVRDILNQESSQSAPVTIDIQVTRINDQSYKIIINSIQFAGNSSDIFKLKNDLLDKNIFVLRRLAIILNKFPEYRIRLEGYAVSEYWDDSKMADWEQKTQLLPLSNDRALEVRAALVLLGVDGNRFSTKGFGGERPIVPNSDLENRWKNRRVEFYLEK